MLRLPVAVVGKAHGDAVDHGLHVDGPAPDPLHVGQRIQRPVELEVDALVLVAQQQLAAVAEIGVLDDDDGLAKVGQAEEELALDGLELAALDDVFLGARVVLVGKEVGVFVGVAVAEVSATMATEVVVATESFGSSLLKPKAFIARSPIAIIMAMNPTRAQKRL